MKEKQPNKNSPTIFTLNDLAKVADYSFIDTLNSDPDATANGVDYAPRQVFSGHYVPVNPTPISQPEYIAHSQTFFKQLGLADSLATSADFIAMFSGDTSAVPKPMRTTGWATGYALSIYGTEYYQQCPFSTGNGYGDGRAISILEIFNNNQRWEMQLKGAGRTPYCRGADGRAVLRSSIREFLAQEHMYALGVPTSRSLSLYVSKTDTVHRPWYSDGSVDNDPDVMISEPVAISTRVAPSFIRVGQIELFGRRARKNEHPNALDELEQIVLHLVEREYANDIDPSLSTADKVVLLAKAFRNRLSALVANWIRVGYCQGNFNSDNCAAGGFTLDYGPFGFCDVFDPSYQPWTGGGDHFAFLNQPKAAEQNFGSFCTALQPLLTSQPDALKQLNEIKNGFEKTMQTKMETMWAAKLGLEQFNTELFKELEVLMIMTPVDYTRFFRMLSTLPDDLSQIKKSFYNNESDADISLYPTYNISHEAMNKKWAAWLKQWNALIVNTSDTANNMKKVNPKYTLREWLVVPAYKQAKTGDYTLVRELQQVMTQPYAEQTDDIEARYDKQKPSETFEIGGISHLSCSS